MASTTFTASSLSTYSISKTHHRDLLEIVFRATNDLELFNKLSYKLLQTVQNLASFDSNPIFAILHESIYCQGYAGHSIFFPSFLFLNSRSTNTDRITYYYSRASNWSASRAVKSDPRFSWDTAKNLPSSEPVYFSGEMVISLPFTYTPRFFKR